MERSFGNTKKGAAFKCTVLYRSEPNQERKMVGVGEAAVAQPQRVQVAAGGGVVELVDSGMEDMD